MNNRAVITGIGVLAANGNSREEFWQSLLEGRSGVGPVTLFDAGEFQCRIAGEVKNFDPHKYIDPTLKPKRRMARATQLAIAAAYQVIEDAGLSVQELKDRGEVPVYMGVSTTAMDLRELPARPWSAISGVPHAVTSAISFSLGFQARLMTISNGCASGMDAVTAAAENIRRGATDLVLAGSSDAALTPYVFKCFESSRKVSLRNDAPEKSCRPFDRDRDGGVAAEAAGIFIIENLQHALARGATIYAELSGYGSSADIPGDREGSGLKQAMLSALANSACPPDQIDHIDAHAPSDLHMDRIEVELIKEVFGEHAYRIPVTSIKGATGNPMAVGGVLQMIATSLSLYHQVIPPTTNLEIPDPQCDLDHVSGQPRHLPMQRAMVNTHGFGRGNSCVLLERYG